MPLRELPPVARKLLADNDAWIDGAPTRWREPRSMSPMEREAVSEAMGALEANLRPASANQIANALAHLRMHARNVPEHDDRAWSLVLADYRQFLAEMPPDILRDGCEAWLKSSPFWPAVSDLLSIMQPMLNVRRAQLARAERLANMPGKRERYEPTPEERRKFADGFRQAADALRGIEPLA